MKTFIGRNSAAVRERALFSVRAAVILAFLLATAAIASAQATVCTFDDLPDVGNGNFGVVPQNYCGIQWLGSGASNTVSYFKGSFTWDGAVIYPHSQPNALYSSNGINFSFPSPAVFNGFWAVPTSTQPGGNEKQAVQVILSGPNGPYTGPVIDVPQGGAFIASGYNQPVYSVNICVGVEVNGVMTCAANPTYMEAIDDISYNGTCSAPIQPNTQQNFPTTGGTGTVMVTAGSGCPWTAASTDSWITVTSGASGTGTGAPQAVSYSVAANTDAGFRNGSLTIAGLSLPIQEAGVAQFQVQGVTAPDGAQGTTNVIGGLQATFSGSGWQLDGGPITISGINISPNTFSPPNFSGNFQFPSIFASSTSPPCTLQVTATQGSITKTVTLTGIYLGQVVLPDTNETGLNAGDQVCATDRYHIAQEFFASRLPIVTTLFAVESATTDLGGSLMFVNNPGSTVQFGDSGILLNPGATLTFPDASGHVTTLQSHATSPIESQVLQPVEGQSLAIVPGPYITNPVNGLQQVNGGLTQSGGVMLDNGVLCVDRDATITGGLAGTGILIAGGNIHVSGNVNLASAGAGSSVVTTTEINWGTVLFHVLPFTSSEAPGAVTVSVDTLSSFQYAAGRNITFTGATPPALTNVPGALKQVSVGADGSVWGVNAQQQIYSYNSDPGWIYIPGELTQVAVGSGKAIWGINAQQQIYRWDSAQSAWVNVPGSLTQIAVGADGDVWGINYESNIYHYDAQTGFFSQVSGTLSQITVGSSGAVYGLNAAGSIFWYNPGTGRFEWIANSIGFTQIATGADGDVWAVENNTAYEYDVLHNSMDARPGASIAHIAIGSGASVFGTGPGGQVFEWSANSQSWGSVPGTLSSIAVGANGAMWGVNAAQQIFTNGQVTHGYQALSSIPGSLTQISVGADGSTWGLNGTTVEYYNFGTERFVPVSGAPPLAQLSVGAGANVWGVDSSGTIYQYSTTGNWNIVPGQLNSIAVGADRSVWGINSSGQTYTYDSSSQSWTNIPGALAQLSVGADGTVWGINAQQQIYRFDATAQSWVNVPGSLAQISVGNANSIWGVNAQQQVYYYDHAAQSWMNVPGAYLKQISVGSDGTVWGVNAAGNLYEWDSSTQSFNFVAVGIANVFTGNVATVWALNSWGGIFSPF